MLLRKACKNAFRAPLAALLLLTSVSTVHGRSLRSFLSDPPGPVHPTVPLSTPPIQTPTARVVFDDTAPFSPKTAGEHRHERNEEAVNARENPNLIHGCLAPDYSSISAFFGVEFAEEEVKAGRLVKPAEDELHSLEDIATVRGADVRYLSRLWRHNPGVDGILDVPYALGDGNVFTIEQRATIDSALAAFGDRIGILRFRPRVVGVDAEWISIESKSDGCWSYIGKTSFAAGGQTLNLSPNGCVYTDIIEHEVMHALGFFHEQSRPDRDDYVTINFQNIKAGSENNFDKVSYADPMGTPYDYLSVMHYGSTYFSANGGTTINAGGNFIGQIDGADNLDVDQIRLMYQCVSGLRSFEEYNDHRCTSDCKCAIGMAGCAGDDSVCHGNAVCSRAGICMEPGAGPPIASFELFPTGSSTDLEGSIIAFDPSQDYQYCIQDFEAWPESRGGTELQMGDDTVSAQSLGFDFPFFGETYSSVFIGSNGYLTFGEGDDGRDASARAHNSLPRISALFTDLNAARPGAVISFGRYTNVFVVNFNNVEQYERNGQYDGDGSSFQVVIKRDGTVILAYKEVKTSRMAVGVGLSHQGALAQLDLSSGSGGCSAPPPTPLVCDPDAEKIQLKLITGGQSAACVDRDTGNVSGNELLCPADVRIERGTTAAPALTATCTSLVCLVSDGKMRIVWTTDGERALCKDESGSTVGSPLDCAGSFQIGSLVSPEPGIEATCQRS